MKLKNKKILKLERLLSFLKDKNLLNIRRLILDDFIEKQKNLIIKRKKLKLGAISFEIVEHFAPGTSFLLFETIDIRFINQDNTEEDENKLETRLEYFKIKNLPLVIFVLSFLFILFFIAFCIISIDLLFNVSSIFKSNPVLLKNLLNFFFFNSTSVSTFLITTNKLINSIFLDVFSYLLIDFFKLI